MFIPVESITVEWPSHIGGGATRSWPKSSYEYLFSVRSTFVFGRLSAIFGNC